MPAHGVPADLLAGACMELWVGDDEKPPSWWERGDSQWRAINAHRRFNNARRAWGDEHGLTRQQLAEVVPRDTPSAQYLAVTGREDDARRRLGSLADSILGSRRPRR